MMSTEYVPIDDVAKCLHVSPATVRGWVRRGKIPLNTYIKVGTTYRFNVDAVVEALRGSEEAEEAVPYVEADNVGNDTTNENNLDKDI
jgi:excisionase family DNA binding protein